MGHTRRTTTSLAALVAGAALALGGCGSDGTTVTTEDGNEVTVEQDGDSIEIESEDGDTTITGETGDELPEGWPEEVVLPEGGTVSGGIVTDADGRKGWTASVAYPDLAPDALTDQLKASLGDSGFELKGEFGSGEGSVASFEGHGMAVSAMVSAEGSGSAALITVAVEE